MTHRVAIQRRRAWRERLLSWRWLAAWQDVMVFDEPFTLDAQASEYVVRIPRLGAPVLQDVETSYFGGLR